MADSKEYITHPDDFGSINISEDVVASIAAASAAEVEGVDSLAANLGQDIAELLGKKNLSRGVKVQIGEDKIIVDVCIIVKYGSAVTAIAKVVQDTVVSAIASMTGMDALTVNVQVVGVAFPKDK